VVSETFSIWFIRIPSEMMAVAVINELMMSAWRRPKRASTIKYATKANSNFTFPYNPVAIASSLPPEIPIASKMEGA
jgi:hypothetical protein